MTLFWLIAAGMMLLALIIVLPPLLRKTRTSSVTLDELNLAIIKQQLEELESDLQEGQLDQNQYQSARRDLERELLQDLPADVEQSEAPQEKSGRWAVGIAAVGIPLLSVLLYQALGDQEVIARLQNPAVAQNTTGHAGSEGGQQALPPMEVLIEKLAARLQEEPDNIEGWLMLARSYGAVGRLDEARRTYETLYRKAPDNAQLLLAYAELLANMQNNRLAGQPAELIDQALALEPHNPNALWMSGLALYERGDFRGAIHHWKQLAAMLPADSEDRASLEDNIREARSNLLPGIDQVATAVSTTAAAAPAEAPAATSLGEAPAGEQTQTGGTAAIRVEISLAPELRDRAGDSDRVFIFAKAMQGPPMPLAAVSRQVRDLPAQLILDESMAMTPQFKLSLFPKVLVGARVSKSGNATPQSGDLEGHVSPVTPGQTELVKVVIDSVRP